MMLIRSYKPQDFSELLEVLSLNIPDYFAPEEKQEFVNFLQQNNRNYFVIEIDNHIVGGGISYLPDWASARIAWDFFHPGHQGRGLGSALVKYRIEKIRLNSSCRSVIVRTSQLAFRFYEKMGFQLLNSEKDFWAKGFDLYEMRLEL